MKTISSNALVEFTADELHEQVDVERVKRLLAV
jgi:hypothetical protein